LQSAIRIQGSFKGLDAIALVRSLRLVHQSRFVELAVQPTSHVFREIALEYRARAASSNPFAQDQRYLTEICVSRIASRRIRTQRDASGHIVSARKQQSLKAYYAAGRLVQYI
jgi:hypothetical protein